MTKLQLLHRALNERLMAAVEQIMEMVGGTVLEYEEETVRARKENEILRRRLRWMEGENPMDWPVPGVTMPTALSPPDEAVHSGPEQQPVSQTAEEPALSLSIKTEPVDASDCQPFRADTSFTASVHSANSETVDPGTATPSHTGLTNSMLWDTANSYMAPLDFDPTVSSKARHRRGRGRSQRMSFACPDCGKVFGREQRLMLHMRVHSTERPYTYRSRKNPCFYGDKKRKRNRPGLLKPSREISDDLSDTSEQTERSTATAKLSVPPAAAVAKIASIPESETVEESSSSGSSSNGTGTSSNKQAELIPNKSTEPRAKMPHCLQCKRVFTHVSRLAMHMKTHMKTGTKGHVKTHKKASHRPEEPKEQESSEKAEKTEKKAQQHPKKQVIRNNETEVERAKAGGQSLFKCPECKKMFARSCWLTFHLKTHKRDRALARKDQKQEQPPSNKEIKTVTSSPTKLSRQSTKEPDADSGQDPLVKKIFSCPYCGKIFSREGWLWNHIRNHVAQPSPKSDTVPPNITITGSPQKSIRRSINESNVGTDKEKTVTVELKRKVENSESSDEQTKPKTPQNKKVTSESKRHSQPKKVDNESAKITPESNESTVGPEGLPEVSPLKLEGKISKKTFPCPECGKIYFHSGWMKVHRKKHRTDKLVLERSRHLVMEMQTEANSQKESLVEKPVKEKKEKKQKRIAEMQDRVESKNDSEQLNADKMPQEERKKKKPEEAEKLPADEVKQKESTTTPKALAACICKKCGKSYARKNWLALHMIGHKKAALRKKANAAAQKKEDTQGSQGSTTTEDSTGQKGKDGGKAEFPCPFCDKVFPRSMRLMVHMQIHSGEKPYSYRQRKEQFYGDLTRPRASDPDSQEPAIESSDEREKDGGFTVTRNENSAVSQEHTSTTEPMETVQPRSVCTGRIFSPLPLQSTSADPTHNTNISETDSKSVGSPNSACNWQPRIVLEPIIAESSQWGSTGGDEFKSVSVSDVDSEPVHAAIDYNVGTLLPQTPLEYSNTCQDSQDVSSVSFTVISETDHPDIVCVRLDSVSKSQENTSYAEKVLVNTRQTQGKKSEMSQKDGQVQSSEEADIGELDVVPNKKTRTRITLPRAKASFSGPVNADGTLSFPEFVSTHSSSTAMQQVVPSDIDDDCDGDDDGWLNVSYLDEKKKEKTSTKHKKKSKRSKVKDSSISKSAKNIKRSSDRGHQNPTLDGEVNANEESEKSFPTFVQQSEESFSDQKRFSCVVCGTVFSGEASLIRHQKRHSASDCVEKTSSTSKELKEKIKKSETKIKQQVFDVQTSEVYRDDSEGKSDISRKKDSTAVEKMKNARSSRDNSDKVTTNRRSRRHAKISPPVKNLNKKTVYCRLCGKACRKIKLHLMFDHPKDPKAMEALCCSKSKEERKELLNQLCCKSVDDINTVGDKLGEEFVHCIFCRGSYQRNEFWKHALTCEQKQPKNDLVLTDTEKSENLPSISPESNLGITKYAPKSEDTNPTAQTLPESINIPLLETECSITQNSSTLAYPVQESSSSETNPTVDPSSGDPHVLNTGDSTEMMKLDSETSDPPILHSCHNKTEKTINPDIGSSVEKNLDVSPLSPVVLDSCQTVQEFIPGVHLENPSILKTSDSPDRSTTIFVCSSPPVLESCPSIAQEELDQNLPCPPLGTRREVDIEKQSASAFDELPHSGTQLPLKPAVACSSLVDPDSIDVQQHTEKVHSSQNKDHCGESVSLPQPMEHQKAECSSLQSNSYPQSKSTTIPTTTFSNLPQTIDLDVESEQTDKLITESSHSQPLPDVVLETAKDYPCKGVSASESTNDVVSVLGGSDLEKELHENENIFFQVSENTEHNKTVVALDCSPVLEPALQQAQQSIGIEMDTAQIEAEQMLGSEDCPEDMDKTAKDTDGVSDAELVAFDTIAAEKRKLDNQRGDQEDKAKKMRKNDTIQESAEEGTAPASALQTSELESGEHVLDRSSTSLKENREAKYKSNKAHCCLYCKKTLFWMTQHLQTEHPNEPDVVKALSYDKNSKERKQLLTLIRIKGNYLHSADVVTSGKSNVSLHSQSALSGSDVDNVQCIFCRGLFSENTIAEHVQKCVLKYPDKSKPSSSEVGLITGTQLPGPLSDPNCVVDKLSPEPERVGSPPTDPYSAKEFLETIPQKPNPPDPESSCSKQEVPGPESICFPVLDPYDNATQINYENEPTWSSTADVGSSSRVSHADLESERVITPDTNLAKSQIGSELPCSTLGDDQTECSKIEDKKTESEQKNQEGQTVERRRRSCRVQAQPVIDDDPSDEEESSSQSSKVHICEHCSATFCSPYHLRRHVYTHTGERPYWCNQCNIGFIQKYRLRNHRMNFHGETQTNADQDGAKRRRKRSHSSENPTQSETLQQPLTESAAASPETCTPDEEREISTNRSKRGTLKTTSQSVANPKGWAEMTLMNLDGFPLG